MKTSLIIGLFSALVFTQTNFEEVKQKVKKNFYPDSLKNQKILDTDWLSISPKLNRNFWYAEIEYPFATNLTSFWDDYSANQYRVNRKDFLDYYKDRKDILYAIIQGPNLMDLWAYSITIIRQMDDHYILSNSYFRHNRFTYKGIGILEKKGFGEFVYKTDSLKDIINATFGNHIDSALYESKKRKNPTWTSEFLTEGSYSGYLIDNIKKDVSFLHGYSGTIYVGNPKIDKFNDKKRLYDSYFYDKIPWEKTY